MKAPKGEGQVSSLVRALKELTQRPNQQAAYFVMLEGAPLIGPIEGPQFLDFMRKNALPPHTKIRANGERDFVPLHQHPHFKREKKIPPPFKEGNGSFYYLENGSKHGPFKRDKIQQLLNAKKLLLTDLLSSDKGNTWHKVFEFEEFDRRLQAKDLPQALPKEYNWCSLDGKNKKNKPNKDKENNALAVLNFFGTLDPSSGLYIKPEEDNQEETRQGRSLGPKLALFFILTMSGALWWWPASDLGLKQKERTPTSIEKELSKTAVEQKKAKKLTPKAAPKIAPRPAPKPKPRPIAKPPPPPAPQKRRPSSSARKKKRHKSFKSKKAAIPAKTDVWPGNEEDEENDDSDEDELEDEYDEEDPEEELERELLESVGEDPSDLEDFEGDSEYY